MSPAPAVELGRLLREARERRGWTLQQLSERTRITLRNLGALESGDYARMPAPVYIRGFVRTLARELGLDEAAALAALDEAGVASPTTGPEAAPQPAREAAGAAPRPAAAPAFRWPVLGRPALLAISVLVAGGIAGLGLRALGRWLGADAGRAIPPSPFQTPPAVVARHATPAIGGSAPETPPGPLPGTARPSATVVSAATGPFTVTIVAREGCEVMFQKDGGRERWVTLEPGRSEPFHALSRLRLLIANPAGVDVTAPGGSVVFPKKRRAAHLMVTAAGVEILPLPGAQPHEPGLLR